MHFLCLRAISDIRHSLPQLTLGLFIHAPQHKLHGEIEPPRGRACVLVHAVEVSETVPAGVQLDIVAETWTYEGKTYKIGSWHRQCDPGCRYGPIGVYKRNSIDNLNSMLHAARGAIRARSTILDD